MKTIEQYFADWETGAFGFGYGSGEEHIIPILKDFFKNIPLTGVYDYKELETLFTPAIAWLLINVLCKEDALEYGTSPRGAWLTNAGKNLKNFLGPRSTDQILEALNQDCNEYDHCYRDSCNCEETGYQAGVQCLNPFWGR